MAARILTKYRISRYPPSIARYKMLQHRPDTPNQSRFWFCLNYLLLEFDLLRFRYRILGLSSSMRSLDGLSNLQYAVIETRKEKLFTLIQVAYNETLIKSSVAHVKHKRAKEIRRRTS